VIDCGTFVDNFVDFFDVRETEFFDAAGNPIRIVDYIEHHSNDVNSVTGLTLHEHGHFTNIVDLVSGVQSFTGNIEIANRPGFGVVVQDVGRFVFDANGNLLFFAGGSEPASSSTGSRSSAPHSHKRTSRPRFRRSSSGHEITYGRVNLGAPVPFCLQAPCRSQSPP
jgi:hypothetical protein